MIIIVVAFKGCVRCRGDLVEGPGLLAIQALI